MRASRRTQSAGVGHLQQDIRGGGDHFPNRDAKRVHRRRRRIAGSLVASCVAFGVVGASAASLGGVTTASLGADSGAVASCDTDGVTLAYTNSYDSSTGVYRTTSVSITNINTACNTKTISITLKDVSGNSLGAGSSTVAAGAATIALSPSASAASVTGAAVVING